MLPGFWIWLEISTSLNADFYLVFFANRCLSDYANVIRQTEFQNSTICDQMFRIISYSIQQDLKIIHQA